MERRTLSGQTNGTHQRQATAGDDMGDDATDQGPDTRPPIGPELEAALTAGRLGHLVTVNPDGSPQVSIVWIGVDDGEVVVGHLGQGRKVRNIERDPRVSLSVEADGRNPIGLDHHVIIHGRARLSPGGAPELLQRLAHTYLGPDVRFPPMDDPPPGNVIRIRIDKVTGVGPWAN
jgi:PPOX class probable F420-dependent enzyme